jgi:hypothetical protein
LWLLNIPLSLLINYTLCFSLVPTHWLCARRVVEGAIFERKKKRVVCLTLIHLRLRGHSVCSAKKKLLPL